MLSGMATRNPIEMPVRAHARACVQVDMVTRFPLVLVRLDDFDGDIWIPITGTTFPFPIRHVLIASSLISNILRAMGYQKPIATCSFHVKENTRKKCKTDWNETLFWRLQQARSRMERNAAWAAIERTFSRPAVTYLRAELDDDMSDRGRPWTTMIG